MSIITNMVVEQTFEVIPDKLNTVEICTSRNTNLCFL